MHARAAPQPCLQRTTLVRARSAPPTSSNEAAVARSASAKTQRWFATWWPGATWLCAADAGPATADADMKRAGVGETIADSFLVEADNGCRKIGRGEKFFRDMLGLELATLEWMKAMRWREKRP